MIFIKSSQEIEKIRKSSRLASQTLDYAGQNIRAGMTTSDLNKLIHDFIVSHNATPATLGYKGYPASSCISINEEVVHGIPGNRVIHEGDLVKIDVTTILNGYYGDTCRTFPVGNISEAAKDLMETTREAMLQGIATVQHGSYIGDIGHAIQSYVEPKGYSVVRDFVGHGVGIKFHESPNVPHYGNPHTGLKLQSGMTITVEPMINQGTFQIRVLSDKWTAVTADGSLSAQFEHSILITKTGAEILTVSS
ncbi:MAG: type I methionyl aminopeptidase [Deltaproteobacteria bacterium]|nr:type I methionyl aminopeptidase [Deltaproteobacteria bacterium]